jgi:hypothetical protein
MMTDHGMRFIASLWSAARSAARMTAPANAPMPTLTRKNSTPINSAAITTIVITLLVSNSTSSALCSIVAAALLAKSFRPPNRK